jgi:hypothetical protein
MLDVRAQLRLGELPRQLSDLQNFGARHGIHHV